MKRSLRLSAFVLAATVMVSGCASNRVDHGGIMAAGDVPAGAVACEGAGWEADQLAQPSYPSQLITFLYLNQTRTDARRLTYSFDISPEGQTRNIQFRSPLSYTDHASLRTAVLSGAEAIAASTYRYTGPGAPRYAQGCSTVITFSAFLSQN